MNDSVSNGPRVERITVEGLFGLYDHIIHLNKVEHITVAVSYTHLTLPTNREV